MSKIGPPKNVTWQPKFTDLPVVPPLSVDEAGDRRRAGPPDSVVGGRGKDAPEPSAHLNSPHPAPEPAVPAEEAREVLPVSPEEEQGSGTKRGGGQEQPRPTASEERPGSIRGTPDWIQMPTARFSAVSLHRFTDAVWVCCQAGGPHKVGVSVAGQNNEQVFVQVTTNRCGGLCIALITISPELARSLDESRTEICDRLVARGLDVAEVSVELRKQGLQDGRGQGSGGENEHAARAEDAGDSL